MSEIIVGDIGGTHARFAVAQVAPGRVVALGAPVVLKVADFPTLEAALTAFRGTLGEPAPQAASLALATPIAGERLKLTNNAWSFSRAELAAAFAPEGLVLVNDFGAVGHAVAQLGPEAFQPICGPQAAWPTEGPVTVLGPGTGLGVALVVRAGGASTVVETEGGHVGFAPTDDFEDRLLDVLRARHGRVSIERILSGPGLAVIHQALADQGGVEPPKLDDRALWTAGLEGADPLAAAAVDRFCRLLGSAAGDFALAHGAAAVAIGGGLGARLGEHLRGGGFADAFTAKGRFEARMKTLPVRLVAHPQPGLFGAAAAFAARM